MISPSGDTETPPHLNPPASTPHGTGAAVEPRFRPWGWLFSLALLAGLGYLYYWRIYLPGSLPPAAPPKRPVPVVATAVQQGDLDLYLNGLGTVTAFYTVTVRSRVDGELVKVAFTEGQLVKQGDLLAQIDPRPYQVQLQQAEGPLARDRAALEIAQQTLARNQELAKSKVISQQELDTQASIVKQTEGAIQTDLAQVANAKLLLDYCRITSPITGRIGLRTIDPGNIIHANDANGLAVVTQLQPIAVQFTIPQDEIARVQRRMRSGDELVVDAYNRDFSLKLATGKLSAIDNQVDPTTGTVRLKAVFANEDSMLFPNQFVNARLLVETQEDVIIVPAAAVQRGPNFTFVYVVKDESTVELRKITLGPTEGTRVVVTDGLAAGERVVTDGLEKLQPGGPVVVRDPQKANAAGKTASPGKSAEKDKGDNAAKPAEPAAQGKPPATKPQAEK